MNWREFGRVNLFCGTIVYSLSEDAGGYTIIVKNETTGESCCVGGIMASSEFVNDLLDRMVKGSVTPVTAYDIIRDTLCDMAAFM